MAPIDLPYLKPIPGKSGQTYWYYRRGSRYVRIKGELGSKEFLDNYWKQRALDDQVIRAPATRSRSIDALIAEYYASPDFKDLKPSTKKTYRNSLNELSEQYGSFDAPDFRYRHINKIIGDMADRPGAANKMLKRLRQLFSLARKLEWITHDPCDGVKPYTLGEIHTWTDDEINQFKDCWAPGTKQRLAFMLQLHTGQRNIDIVKEPWPSRGLIRITQEKTGRHLWLPPSAELEAELARHPKRHAMILVTDYGKPRSTAGYGNWMRAAIEKANLPARCSPHGLRKAAAKHLAEAGCTAHEIKAITGHASLAEVERYTRAVEQRRMAERAIEKRNENARLVNLEGKLVNPSKTPD